MIRQFSRRMQIIGSSPVTVYIASDMRDYWYPHRLINAGVSGNWPREESLTLMVDSAISDDEIGNEETLDRAHELHADYVVPADVLHSQSRTTKRVREFIDIYDEHPCTARPLIPLQPPYRHHYPEFEEHTHFVLGGMATEDPDEQVAMIRQFRDVAGYRPYAHGLGLGGSLTTIRALRDDPRLLDSLDLATTEQSIVGNKLIDKTCIQHEFEFPTGDRSSAVRANYAQAAALMVNYLLGPYCGDDVLEDGGPEQVDFGRFSGR